MNELDQINWDQKRKVWYDPNSGEYYVQVMSHEFMLDTDYIEGGQTLHKVQLPSSIEEIGTFTNAEIDNGKYIKEEDKS